MGTTDYAELEEILDNGLHVWKRC